MDKEYNNKKKISLSVGTGDKIEPTKHYKRRSAKVKRSKSQGYRHDVSEMSATLLGSESPSTDEDLSKLKDTVKKKGRSNRKLTMMDWDRTPFVFSVRSKSEEPARAPNITRCKSISTIEEEEEGDILVAKSLITCK